MGMKPVCLSVACLILAAATPCFSADFSVKAVAGYPISDSGGIERFYTERSGALLWVSSGQVTQSAKDIIEFIEGSWEQGLNPENYHLNALKAFEKNGVPSGREDESEILISDSFIRFGHDLSGMRISPFTLGEDASSWSRGIDGYTLLKILSEKDDPVAFLKQLTPQDEIYQRLVGELKNLVADMARHPGKEKTPLPYPGLLRPGSQNAAILEIRKHLGDTKTSDIYDEALKEKVEDFQRLNGLAADGLIGQRSFNAINQTRTQKLVKVIANLERRRWVRRPMPLKYVAVNIPEMHLQAVENNKVMFEMPVIIGREKRPTMSFVDAIEGIRFNPSWYVPDTIKQQDYLPELKKNPHALDEKGIAFRLKDVNGVHEVATTDIDWAKVTNDDLKNIQMVQGPGDDNALGAIRVLMPNRYDIYLHDTNAPELFKKDDRALSSGCVRLSEPRRMANFVLEQNPGWADHKIDEYIAKQKVIERQATVPVPVYLFYFTVWLDDKDRTVIANDVYGFDLKLVQALQKYKKIPFELDISE
jgi:murein L,D-transpeptidase YcbB/YkuD